MKTNMLTTKPEAPAELSCTDLLAAFRVLTTPSCWLQNYPYSPEWDKELNRLMASQRFENVDKYTATLGRHEVWISNHPYASFTLRNLGVRPKRSTILRAQRKLIGDVIAANNHSTETR